MTKNNLPPIETQEITPEEFRKVSRRRFFTWAVLALSGLWGLRKIYTSELDRELPWPLRKVTDGLDGFWKSNFNEKALAPTEEATDKPLRLNGDIGMEKSLSAEDWRLSIMDQERPEPMIITLEDIKKLPAVTETFEFKCIEGWSEITTCTGVRFSDFMKAFGVGTRSSGEADDPSRSPYGYVSLATTNKGYYVSMDMKSMSHPQTLLCYAMNNKPLDMKSGFPLRLMTPVKYGVKNIKQIGSIAFSDSPPADYWAENGYGDYLGL